MTLGRLLAAGKSLIGLNRGNGRYRQDKNVRLPKFISPKNPFLATAEDAPVLMVAPAVESEKGIHADPVDQFISAKPAVKSGQKRSAWFGAVGAKLNPFTAKSRAVSPARSLTLHQGELSLDRIKVIRNDLRDSDSEATPPLNLKSTSPVMAVTAERLEPVGVAWNWLARRFLGEDQN